MTNRKNKQKFMTHDKRTVFFQSKIIEILEKNKECSNGAFKNVFKVQHPTKDELLECILWERSVMETGDKIDIKGFFKDNLFICYSAMVNKYGNIQNTP